MCLMGRGPGKRVDISLNYIGDDDHIIIQNGSIAHNILTTTLADTNLSCSNLCLLIHKTDAFLVVFTMYYHYVFPGESNAECAVPSFAASPHGRDPQLEAYQARDSDPGGPNVIPKGKLYYI